MSSILKTFIVIILKTVGLMKGYAPPSKPKITKIDQPILKQEAHGLYAELL